MNPPIRISVLVAAVTLLAALAAPAAAQQRKPWQHAPGPIAGQWRVSCADSAGMRITITLSTPTTAAGVISRLGAAKQFGYKAGETIFKLTALDSGAWSGKHLWRSVAGAKRWDPIYLVAKGDTLHAQMSTDSCYRNMTRVR